MMVGGGVGSPWGCVNWEKKATSKEEFQESTVGCLGQELPQTPEVPLPTAKLCTIFIHYGSWSPDEVSDHPAMLCT